MMQVIGESDAEILFWYFSEPNVMAIVTEYGFYDDDNTDYIDWKKGHGFIVLKKIQYLKKNSCIAGNSHVYF